MSVAPKDLPRAGSANAVPARSLFQHEVRRDGRIVVTLSAREATTGVTVESEVFAVTHVAGEAGLTRPFTFTSLDHARRFADEALVAFEYLGCTIT